jgi:dTDP-4-amino-4,6-dideoxygalactose transaminase
MKLIPLIRPYITAQVKAEVQMVLDSGFLTEGADKMRLRRNVETK